MFDLLPAARFPIRFVRCSNGHPPTVPAAAQYNVGALLLGVVPLIDGGMTPPNAAVPAICGAGVAVASTAYLQRWTHGFDAPAAAAAPRLHRSSMHQPV